MCASWDSSSNGASIISSDSNSLGSTRDFIKTDTNISILISWGVIDGGVLEALAEGSGGGVRSDIKQTENLKINTLIVGKLSKETQTGIDRCVVYGCM